MTYKIHASLTITNLNCIQLLHHSEIKYQGEEIPILCTMGAHGLQPEVEFSNFLALQISNPGLVMRSRRRSTATNLNNKQIFLSPSSV